MESITSDKFRYIKNTGQNDGTPGLDLNVTHVWERGITGKGTFKKQYENPFIFNFERYAQYTNQKLQRSNLMY